MKKMTNKILLGLLIAVLLLTVVVVVSARRVVSNVMAQAGEVPLSGRQVQRGYDVSGFQTISLAGGWRLSVTGGERFSVEVSGDSALVDAVQVSVSGDTLLLHADSTTLTPRGGLHARVVLPELTGLHNSGGSDIRLEGLNSTTLTIVNSGAGRFSADGAEFGHLRIDGSGATTVEFFNARVHTAEVFLSGAGKVELHMTGGDLSGRISGIGNVEYSGTVSAESIRIDGIGTVERTDH